jgi:predicted metal-dependent peptidase
VSERPVLDARQVAALRLWAADRMPYLASAVFATQFVVAEGIGTVAVDDRWRVRADPAVLEQFDVPAAGALYLHLIGHLLREHASRADARSQQYGGEAFDPARWNRCGDAEINDDLGNLVPAVAPDLPQTLSCAPGKLAEHYYERATDGPRQWDCGSGADGQPRGWDGPPGGREGQGDGLGAGEAHLLRLAVAADVQRAGREPGVVPGGLLLWAESILPSRVDWRRVLAAEVRRAVALVAGRVDYTYRKPSRRAATAFPVVLPSLVRPVPEVAVVCDTSGSMVDQLLERALNEVEGILTRAGLPSGSVRVLAVDTCVHAVRRASRASQVTLAGGGGTDMGAGIAAAAELRPRPGVVVVLTDGYTPWPERPPQGVTVIVGLLQQPGLPETPVPSWARCIRISDDA